MSIVSTGFIGVFTLVDEDENKSVLKYDLVAANYADAVTACGTIATTLAAVTAAAIKGYNITQQFAENALVLPDEVNIEKRAVITAKLAATLPQKYANIIIPAPESSVWLSETGPNAKVVDPDNAAVIAYLDNFYSGGTAYVSDGQTIMDPAAEGTWVGHKKHRSSSSG